MRKISIGDKYGILTVIDVSKGYRNIICVCECGSLKSYVSGNLRSGNTKSCGCIGTPGNTKHGDRHTRLYGIWRGVKERCLTKSCSNYKNYGGRGIKVCEDWKDYLKFKEWALNNGYKDDLTIERIDVNGNYCPENCKWASYEEQANNTRRSHFLTFKGETLTIKQWSKKLGICPSTIYRRLKKEYPIEKVLSESR